MDWWQILVACGIPSGIFGIMFAYIIRKQTRDEKLRDERQHNLETLNLMMLQSTRANTILCVATAEAVRDGHCNGNMTAALKAVEAVAAKEKEFLLEKSIKYIFE
jgi:hypothetical protein